MRVVIVGAGTIGLTYGFLLSEHHTVTHLVRPGRREHYERGVTLHLKDLREGGGVRGARYHPRVVDRLDGVPCDMAFVMVDAAGLDEAVAAVARLPEAPGVFMLNRWSLAGHLESRLPRSRFYLGFPSQVGGGRVGLDVDATIFAKGTVLEDGTRESAAALDAVQAAFEVAGLSVRRQRRMGDWLQVHCLQQSLSAAPILEAGGYDAFAADRRALGRLVVAFREGLAVCRATGCRTAGLWPTPLFALPRPVVASLLQGMFRGQETRTMVTRHMRHGLSEWVEGFWAIHADAGAAGLATPALDHQAGVLRSHGWGPPG